MTSPIPSQYTAAAVPEEAAATESFSADSFIKSAHWKMRELRYKYRELMGDNSKEAKQTKAELTAELRAREESLREIEVRSTEVALVLYRHPAVKSLSIDELMEIGRAVAATI